MIANIDIDFDGLRGDGKGFGHSSDVAAFEPAERHMKETLKDFMAEDPNDAAFRRFYICRRCEYYCNPDSHCDYARIEGTLRPCAGVKCLEEGIFKEKDLTERDKRVLKNSFKKAVYDSKMTGPKYIATHNLSKMQLEFILTKYKHALEEIEHEQKN